MNTAPRHPRLRLTAHATLAPHHAAETSSSYPTCCSPCPDPPCWRRTHPILGGSIARRPPPPDCSIHATHAPKTLPPVVCMLGDRGVCVRVFCGMDFCNLPCGFSFLHCVAWPFHSFVTTLWFEFSADSRSYTHTLCASLEGLPGGSLVLAFAYSYVLSAVCLPWQWLASITFSV